MSTFDEKISRKKKKKEVSILTSRGIEEIYFKGDLYGELMCWEN